MTYKPFKTIEELIDLIPNPPHRQLKDMAIKLGVYQKFKYFTK